MENGKIQIHQNCDRRRLRRAWYYSFSPRRRKAVRDNRFGWHWYDTYRLFHGSFDRLFQQDGRDPYAEQEKISPKGTNYGKKIQNVHCSRRGRSPA